MPAPGYCEAFCAPNTTIYSLRTLIVTPSPHSQPPTIHQQSSWVPIAGFLRAVILKISDKHRNKSLPDGDGTLLYKINKLDLHKKRRRKTLLRRVFEKWIKNVSWKINKLNKTATIYILLSVSVLCIFLTVIG